MPVTGMNSKKITEVIGVIYSQFSKTRYRVYTIEYPVWGDFFILTADLLTSRPALKEVEIYRGRAKASALEAIREAKDKGFVVWEKLAAYIRSEKQRRGEAGYFRAAAIRAEEKERIEEREQGKKIQCKVCGRWYHNVAAHLPKHKLSREMYLRKYPGAPLLSPYTEQTLDAARSLERKPRKKVEPSKGLRVLHVETLTGGVILTVDSVQATIRIRGKAVQIARSALESEWLPVRIRW